VHPAAKPWSVYLTPQAATIPVKGWKADLNRPGTPLPEASLGQCLDWLCRRVPALQYELVDDKILIDVKSKKNCATRPSKLDAMKRNDANAQLPATQPAAVSGDTIAWADAVEMIKNGKVRSVVQYHAGDAILTTVDGIQVKTRQPKSGEARRLIEKVDPTGSKIIYGTE
jgi:hypothetical protein